ncbi:MAG: hypothetical protein ACLSE8_14395 [Parasutterella sp.]
MVFPGSLKTAKNVGMRGFVTKVNFIRDIRKEEVQRVYINGVHFFIGSSKTGKPNSASIKKSFTLGRLPDFSTPRAGVVFKDVLND